MFHCSRVCFLTKTKEVILLGSLSFICPSIYASGVDVRVGLSFEHTDLGPTVKVTVSNHPNGSQNRAVIASPNNRNALAFVVFDSRGQLVVPVGIGKADPLSLQLDLAQSESHQMVQTPCAAHADIYLRYLTHTGLFGYRLSPTQEYRVTAIYRPWGDSTYGRTSQEIVVRLDSLPAES